MIDYQGERRGLAFPFLKFKNQLFYYLYLFKINNMIIRNNWRHPKRQWDKLAIKLRVSSLDIFTV